ncbi:hypothetical protein ONZ45_g13582 [Pleurotus djamor]|nr:hypothetical protein ONZ45_g13582 [Pleurotus djamor]
MSSAVSEVLSTPKLLRIIFSLSDNNRSSLFVNKTWAEEVICVEWNEVDQPEWLFRLLAPLVRSRRDLSLYTFNRPLESTDWDRFNHYAFRVKAFIQDSILLDVSAIKALHKTRDQTHDGLLPNVDYVCCPIDPDSLHIYLHPRLHSLTLCLDLDLDINLQHSYLNVRNIKKSFSIISQRVASSLGVLCLNCQLNDYLLRFADEKLALTLRELKELTEVTIPPHWLSERVTLASNLFSVETLELQGLAETHIVATLSPLLETHSFPLLTSLSLLVPFEKAIAAFSSWGGSAHLLSLFIDSEMFEPPERYKTMCSFHEHTAEYTYPLPRV